MTIMDDKRHGHIITYIYSMRRVNPATTKFDVAVEVVEVARFHAHEVSIAIVYNLALTYIVPRSIGMEEARSCCGRRA